MGDSGELVEQIWTIFALAALSVICGSFGVSAIFRECDSQNAASTLMILFSTTHFIRVPCDCQHKRDFLECRNLKFKKKMKISLKFNIVTFMK